MKILLLEDIPRWYTLHYCQRKHIFAVGVHQDALPLLKERMLEPAIVRSAMNESGLTSLLDTWNPDVESSEFGIAGHIKKGTCGAPFHYFHITVPVFQQYGPSSCEYCNGSGLRNDDEDKCLQCDGLGKKLNLDHHTIAQAAMSLSFLLHALDRPPETDTSSEYSQTAMVTYVAGVRNAVVGTFSPTLMRLVQGGRFRYVARGIEDAMVSIRKRMFGASDIYRDDFRVSIESSGVSLSCPGQACGIHTTNMHCGAEFSDHNVDSVHQGLTLLAGIAALTEASEVMFPINRRTLCV